MNPKSVPIDSSDEENVATATRRRLQNRRGGGGGAAAASAAAMTSSAAAPFPDPRPIEEEGDEEGGGVCRTTKSAKVRMSTTPTSKRKSKKKQQAKRNLDEIQTFEEVYEKITEALKLGNEINNTKTISDLMLEKGVEMLTASSPATSPPKRFTPAEAYDVFGSFILESQGAATEKMTNTFFTKYVTSVKKQSASAKESPYDALGFVFNSPLFEEQRIQDVRDVDRRRTGPAMRKGVVKCRKCKSKYTDSRPKQDRSGDEPMSFLHDCRVCGEHWKTSG